MIFLDETGFSLVSPLKASWAPIGHTPRIRTSLSHQQRLNLIGALMSSAKGRRLRLRIATTPARQTGTTVLHFLRGLLASLRGPLVLLWDNAPIHTRKMVQAFIATQSRLHVFAFPSYAPELNPVEYLWAQVSEHLACRAPMSLDELKCFIHAAVQRSRSSRRRLEACLLGSHLPWSRRLSHYLFKTQ